MKTLVAETLWFKDRLTKLLPKYDAQHCAMSFLNWLDKYVQKKILQNNFYCSYFEAHKI